MESGFLTCHCSDFPGLRSPIFEGRHVDVMEQTRDRVERQARLETLCN